MITNVEQRWDRGRAVFVPPSHVVANLAAYDVAEIPDDTTAKAFVQHHHYSASYPAARQRGGLYLRGRLVGVAVASQPMSAGVLAALPCPAAEARELGRLVLAFDGASPFNLASWFIARWTAILLREHGIRGLVSFSDPMPRTDATGVTTFKGHVGTTYAASNAAYAGRSTARTLRMLPNGDVLCDRSISKVRGLERGHEHVEALLVRHGAVPRRARDDAARWLARWLQRLTRPVRHPGNYRYLFGLDKQMRAAIEARVIEKFGARQPYPKLIVQA